MTVTNPTPPEQKSIQVTVPFDLVDRLDVVCARLMIGRPLVVARAVAAMVDHLEAMPDPLAGLRVASGTPAPAASGLTDDSIA